MNIYLYVSTMVLLCSFYVSGAINHKIDIYQNGLSQKYKVVHDDIQVYFYTDSMRFPNLLGESGMFVNRQLINFNERPSFWFSNDSSARLDSYLTLFIENETLKVDCIYANSFDNYNGFYQKRSKCGLNIAPFEDELLLESLLYDEKLIEQMGFSFDALSEEMPIKILVGELNELKIYRIYSSVEDYKGNNYYILISSKNYKDISIKHPIYLRYNTINELIGLDIETEPEGLLQFFSHLTLNKLLKNGFNPVEVQAVINVDKAYLYTEPSTIKKDNKYLVHLDQITLLDEYNDSKGIGWYKIMFKSAQLGTLIAWIQQDYVDFIAE